MTIHVNTFIEVIRIILASVDIMQKTAIRCLTKASVDLKISLLIGNEK